MGRWSWLVGFVVVVALTVASGVIQGRMGNRWGPPPALLAAAEKLQQLPETVKGPARTWEVSESKELTQTEQNMLRPAAYVCRTYVCRESDSQLARVVGVTLLVGPTGPTSVHNPEVCYSAQAFPIEEVKGRVAVGEVGDEFWGETVRSKGIDHGKLRVCWGWSAGGAWTAPDDARFQFAGRSYLYKIQLSSHLAPGSESPPSDACKEFLEDFVPFAKAYLMDTEANGH